MSALTKFQSFVQALGRGQVNLNADVLKIMLSDVAPNAATGSTTADITEIAAGNGYTAGGTAVGGNAYSQTAGVGKLTGGDVTFTAAGGSIAQFRYIVLYDSTTNHLIAYGDFGSEVNVTTGNSFIVHWTDAGTVILSIT